MNVGMVKKLPMKRNVVIIMEENPRGYVSFQRGMVILGIRNDVKPHVDE